MPGPACVIQTMAMTAVMRATCAVWMVFWSFRARRSGAKIAGTPSNTITAPMAKAVSRNWRTYRGSDPTRTAATLGTRMKAHQSAVRPMAIGWSPAQSTPARIANARVPQSTIPNREPRKASPMNSTMIGSCAALTSARRTVRSTGLKSESTAL